MTRSIVVGLAILSLSTSAALAAQRTHHRHVMNANAAVAATPTMGAINSSDRANYLKNLRDAGYNPKNDYQSNGVIRDHLP
jgi:hypothetical protein